MQTKQFTGDTIDDVLTQVRGELGDDAVILETRNIVRGGIAGFFGKAGIEVTAADRMPDPDGQAGERRLDVLDTAEPAPAADGAVDSGEFLRRLGEHLTTAPETAPGTAEAGAAPTPDGTQRIVDDRERARAIIEAARAAVREAAAAPAAPAAQDPAPARTEEATPAGDDAPFVAAPIVASTTAAAAPAAPAARIAAAPGPVDTPPMQEPEAPMVPGAPAAAAAGTPDPAAGTGEALVAQARPVPTRGDVQAVRDELVACGVEERRLDSLLDGFTRSTLPFLDPGACTRSAVRDYLAARMPVVRDWRPWRTGHTVALVGQSGVGKTASAVKIAGRHRAAGMDVALIAAGPGPHGSLLEWARRLDLTVVEAPDAHALSHACARLASRDLIIIDTPGCSHTSGDEVSAVAAMLDAVGTDEVHLVLPAATPSGDLGDLQTAFKPLAVNRVTLTKLDETRFFGGVLNAPMRIGRPLAYIADGAALPGAIAPADPRLVAELLLP